MRSLRKSFGARGVVAMEAEEIEQQEARQREEDEAIARGEGGGATSTDVEDEETGAGEELLPEESTSENVETELMDATDASAEVDDQVDQVEEAEDVVEAMEAYVELMKTAAENGGLDRHGARAVQIGLEQLYSRVGLTPSKLMPAMESYGGVSSRIGATHIAMEEVSEQAKKVWQAIVAAFERLMNWVKDLWAKFAKSAEATKARADRLAQAASQAKGEKEPEINNARMIAGFAVGNEADPMKAAEELKSLVDKQQTMAIVIGTIISKAEELLAKPEGGAEFTKSVVEALSKAFGEKGSNDDGMLYQTEPLPGNVSIYVRLKTEGDKFASGEAGIKAHEEGKAPEKIESLTAEQAGKVAETIATLADKIALRKNELDKIVTASEGLVAKLKGMVGKEEGDSSEAKKAASFVQKLVAQLLPAIDKVALNASKHVLDAVEASIRGHKGEKKEEKPAEKTEEEKQKEAEAAKKAEAEKAAA